MTSKKQNDTVAESKKTGEMTTDSGKKVEAISPAVPHGAENAVETDEPKVIRTEALVGELSPGEEGFLPLDAEGHPIGPAQKTHEGMEFWAPVQAPGNAPAPDLVTPSGAPITERMNPTQEPE